MAKFLAVCVTFSMLSARQLPAKFSIEGKWNLTAATDARGKNLRPADIKAANMRCDIKTNLFILYRGNKTEKMTFTIDQTTTPASITFILPDNEGTNHGICSISKNRLIICVSNKWGDNAKRDRPGSLNPRDKANAKHTAVMQFVFERKTGK